MDPRKELDRGLGRVILLGVSKTNVSDPAPLAHLTELRALYIADTKITNLDDCARSSNWRSCTSTTSR